MTRTLESPFSMRISKVSPTFFPDQSDMSAASEFGTYYFHSAPSIARSIRPSFFRHVREARQCGYVLVDGHSEIEPMQN